MNSDEQIFKKIAQDLSREIDDISEGKMMSSPGIKYRNKVFAFYHNDKMVFRLGRDFKPESVGINDYSHLSPFKSKPPLRDWFEVPATHINKWELLARKALAKMQST